MVLAATVCTMNCETQESNSGHQCCLHKPVSNERCNVIKVRFHLVDVIEFPTILGFGSCSGPALTFGWDMIRRNSYDLNCYESPRQVHKREGRDLILSNRARIEILKQNATQVNTHHSYMGELKEVLKERPAMVASATANRKDSLPSESKPLQVPIRRGSMLSSSKKRTKRKDSMVIV